MQHHFCKEMYFVEVVDNDVRGYFYFPEFCNASHSPLVSCAFAENPNYC